MGHSGRSVKRKIVRRGAPGRLHLAPQEDTAKGVRAPLHGLSEDARLQEQQGQRAGEPRLEGKLDGARRPEGVGQHRVENEPENRRDGELRQAQSDLDDELLHARVARAYAGRSPRARRPCSARMRVTSSAYSRSPPTGMPRAIRVTLPTLPASRSLRYIAVASPSSVGFVARITSVNGAESAAASSTRASSSRIFSRSGPMPSMGEIAPWSTWYMPRNSPVRSSARTSSGSSTTHSRRTSRPESRQIGHSCASLMLKQRSQKTTSSRTATRAEAR